MRLFVWPTELLVLPKLRVMTLPGTVDFAMRPVVMTATWQLEHDPPEGREES